MRTAAAADLLKAPPATCRRVPGHQRARDAPGTTTPFTRPQLSRHAFPSLAVFDFDASLRVRVWKSLHAAPGKVLRTGRRRSLCSPRIRTLGRNIGTEHVTHVDMSEVYSQITVHAEPARGPGRLPPARAPRAIHSLSKQQGEIPRTAHVTPDPASIQDSASPDIYTRTSPGRN